MKFVSIICLLFISLSLSPTQSLDCLDYQGNPTSWYFLLKYPHKTQEIHGEDNKYAYYDVSMSSSSSDFVLRNHFIDDQGEALYSTLNQINGNKNLQVIAWNDEPADGGAAPSENSAHSKGLIIYDSSAKKGVYIVHSMPKYPAFDSNGKVNTLIPTSERKFGQNVLCMNLDAQNLDNVASGLGLIASIIYFNNFNDQSLPNLYAFSQKTSVQNKANSKNIQFVVDSQLPFLGFFKNPFYEQGFIFEDVMIPVLQSNLFVESWGRPYQAPSCNQYQCLNIESIQIQDDKLGSWNNVDDHSKWGITDSGNYVCSGDMNRMTSQAKRGGAFFCFSNAGLWGALNAAVVKKDSCSRASNFLSN